VSLVKAAVGPQLQVTKSFSRGGNRDCSRTRRSGVQQYRYVLRSEGDVLNSE
jgi:hypothetical protein